jgi:ABC-type phosphate transport system permease subunit
MSAGLFHSTDPVACAAGCKELEMVFDASVALTWVLYLALFPMAFFWLRRAWRILVKRDFSEVALKRGQSPADPEKFAPYEMMVNLTAGVVAVVVVVAVPLVQLDYNTWTAIAGSTIWCKFFAGYALSRHAHSNWAQRKT